MGKEDLNFRLYRLRFSFVAREPVCFPDGKAGNVVRGAFGEILRKIACVPGCPGPQQCEVRGECPYARMFEPRAVGKGPSGLADWPRPFVFRAVHLDGRTVERGEGFCFDLNLFDVKHPAVEYLALTFAQLAREGVGPMRGRADLAKVTQLDEGGQETQVFDGPAFGVRRDLPPLTLSLEPPPAPVERLRVRFVTPTELKSGRETAERPDFGVLAARIRDRLSTLRQLYDSGPLPIDFSGFGERAGRVRMTRCELTPVKLTRRSSRTGQRHPIGGFIGDADYEGELGEFVPYLKAARFTGVGRQTVWGKGEVEVTLLCSGKEQVGGRPPI